MNFKTVIFASVVIILLTIVFAPIYHQARWVKDGVIDEPVMASGLLIRNSVDGSLAYIDLGGEYHAHRDGEYATLEEYIQARIKDECNGIRTGIGRIEE